MVFFPRYDLPEMPDPTGIILPLEFRRPLNFHSLSGAGQGVLHPRQAIGQVYANTGPLYPLRPD
ncbi:hypothetical protein D0V11_20230 [Salmonella enterica]|nr:hypothetical protein [Salmonella enterica]EBN7970260.1 hypothetical protein [Salmonella enterica]